MLLNKYIYYKAQKSVKSFVYFFGLLFHFVLSVSYLHNRSLLSSPPILIYHPHLPILRKPPSVPSSCPFSLPTQHKISLLPSCPSPPPNLQKISLLVPILYCVQLPSYWQLKYVSSAMVKNYPVRKSLLNCKK